MLHANINLKEYNYTIMTEYAKLNNNNLNNNINNITTTTLESDKFGTLHYRKNDIFLFEKGLYNFESYTKYLLFPFKENKLFYGLQSLHSSSLGFFLVQPKLLLPSYSLESFELGFYNYDCNFAILTAQEKQNGRYEISMNLLGPIILNLQERKGWQIISSHQNYQTKHVFELHLDKHLQVS